MLNIDNARHLLHDLKDCAVKADIYKYWFIMFGTLLGAVRPTLRKIAPQPYYIQGIMEHDDDMDVGIFHDRVTAEQEEAYLRYLHEAKCFKAREKYQRRSDTNRLLWFSLRREVPPTGTKCCHWLFYEWNGFMWHSKGKDWLNELKFPSKKYPHTQDDDAIGKGLPAKYLSPDDLVEVTFEGEPYNVPVKFGMCMDFLYPHWLIPKAYGSSETSYIMKVGKWNDQKTWMIF